MVHLRIVLLLGRVLVRPVQVFGNHILGSNEKPACAPVRPAVARHPEGVRICVRHPPVENRDLLVLQDWSGGLQNHCPGLVLHLPHKLAVGAVAVVGKPGNASSAVGVNDALGAGAVHSSKVQRIGLPLPRLRGHELVELALLVNHAHVLAKNGSNWDGHACVQAQSLAALGLHHIHSGSIDPRNAVAAENSLLRSTLAGEIANMTGGIPAGASRQVTAHPGPSTPLQLTARLHIAACLAILVGHQPLLLVDEGLPTNLAVHVLMDDVAEKLPLDTQLVVGIHLLLVVTKHIVQDLRPVHPLRHLADFHCIRTIHHPRDAGAGAVGCDPAAASCFHFGIIPSRSDFMSPFWLSLDTFSGLFRTLLARAHSGHPAGSTDPQTHQGSRKCQRFHPCR